MRTVKKNKAQKVVKEKELREYIRDVPNFPKEGILFKDITTLLKDPSAFRRSVDILYKRFKGKKIDQVIAIESRGFIFGGALAYKLGAGFVPVRKKGKLPSQTKSVTYELEYGTDSLEIHIDAIAPGSRVLIIDDLLATGGTAEAVVRLVKTFDANIVGVAFLIDLTFLKGREKLKSLPVYTIIEY